jgi:hypothetical protein
MRASVAVAPQRGEHAALDMARVAELDAAGLLRVRPFAAQCRACNAGTPYPHAAAIPQTPSNSSAALTFRAFAIPIKDATVTLLLPLSMAW